VIDIVAALSRRRMCMIASHVTQFSVTTVTLKSGG